MFRKDSTFIWHLAGLLIFRFSYTLAALLRWPSHYAFWMYAACTYLLTISLFYRVHKVRIQFHVQTASIRQVVIWGLGVGLAAASIQTLFNCIFQNYHFHFSGKLFSFPVILALPFLPIVQFLVAATLEEPLFRGFLWGHLKTLGRPEWQILLIQSSLFFMAHAYYSKPGMYTNWANTFIAGIFFGVSAWKTRSILPSMVAHSVANSLLIMIQ